MPRQEGNTLHAILAPPKTDKAKTGGSGGQKRRRAQAASNSSLLNRVWWRSRECGAAAGDRYRWSWLAEPIGRCQ